MKPSVHELCRDVIETAARPLRDSITLPRQVYTDPAYFEYEAETVLKRGWLAIAHVSQLKAPGDYLNVELLDEPLTVIRGKDEIIRVLSRVCPHRAMDVMAPESGAAIKGNAPILVCPYHRWSFDLDGQLKGCPEMHQAEGFRKSDWRLPEIRSAIWEGFVFVDLSGTAAPIEPQFADFQRRVSPWKLGEMEVVIELEWDCAFNWKVMIENWAESYHHLGSHHGTLNQVMPAHMTWTEPQTGNFICCHLPYKPEVAKSPPQGFRPIPGLTRQQQAEWGVFVGLPCFMFLTAPDRAIWYRLLPVAAERCKLTTTVLVAPENLEDPDFAARIEEETTSLSKFHIEDMEVNVGVQRGLRSSRAVRGRLSHLEEPVWRVQRFLATQILAARQAGERAA
ncbi:MAG TPA: aromatic ring-hydroxylating dioxygenase subunit alpha [Aliidongia sp.]|nr:aromatic ring-hydroxylating dioxygenase subunit alpha [Aliidongia sp.]